MPVVPPELDHLVVAAPDFAAGVAAVEDLLGVHCLPGGIHPAWGTRNALLPLGPATYLEVIGPDPEGEATSLPELFGIAVLPGPRLVTWAAKGQALRHLAAQARSCGIDLGEVFAGSRLRPDGVRLDWELTDPLRPRAGGVVPFFIDWANSPHPATAGPPPVQLLDLRAEHPEPELVKAQLRNLSLALQLHRGPAPALFALLQTPKGRIILGGDHD